MKISDAIDGYIVSSLADDSSELTLREYRSALFTLIKFLDDKELKDITQEDVRRFMVYLRTDYVPERWGGNTDPLSSASLRRYWKAMRSFFKWVHAEYGLERPDINLKMPRFQNKEIKPLKEEEVKALYKPLDKVEVMPNTRHGYKFERPTQQRDKAIFLLLLDTGLRAGECCRLKVEDVNIKNGEVHIHPHHINKTRPRTVFLGKAGRKAMWRYLSIRKDARPGDPLFLTQHDIPITPDSLKHLFKRASERAGVLNVHPHRMRHTFAVQYLKNGGDIFTIQRQLGHSTWEMVKRYLTLSQADDYEAHRSASPADNWHL